MQRPINVNTPFCQNSSIVFLSEPKHDYKSGHSEYGLIIHRNKFQLLQKHLFGSFEESETMFKNRWSEIYLHNRLYLRFLGRQKSEEETKFDKDWKERDREIKAKSKGAKRKEYFHKFHNTTTRGSRVHRHYDSICNINVLS